MMKTIRSILLIALVLMFLVLPTGLSVWAASSCLDTGCSGDQVCKGNPPTCQANSAACVPACTGDTPICVNGSCQSASQYNNGQTNGSGGGFVPLETNSPLYNAEVAAGNGGSITSLLTQLYNICVGIAVVLAVIQLTRAGITYMLSDSITNKEQARHLIMTSVLGLLLVLSPVIVFSLINPDILRFNFGIDSLKVAPEGQNPAPPTNPPANPPPGH